MTVEANILRRASDAVNLSHNEQQKFVFLVYAAGKLANFTRADTLSAYELRVMTISVDLDFALTFAEIARQSTKGSKKRCRVQTNARKAYETTMRFFRCCSFTEEDASMLEEKFTRVRNALARLGESL